MPKITDQIKERLDIVEVIGSYIKLDKAGINYKAKCPFHNEKSPSFFVSPSRQSFYCFGCQAGGDILSFVEKFEGLDFKGALQNLADRAGIVIPHDEWRKEKKDENDRLFEIMEKATSIYQENFASAKKEHEYLKKRGLSDESIKKWRIGFAKDEWRDLFDKLQTIGFSSKEMIEAGLIKKVSLAEKYYDTFRNRIVFPIFDVSGRVIAFSGRAMKEDEKTPKYLNSPETSLFKKSEVLYGFNFAKESIRKLDYSVLVEGQMDLILSVQVGIKNTVASSGTALTEKHMQRLHKLSKRVIIAYDGDDSGLSAAQRAASIALALGMEVKIGVMPDGEDPASVAVGDPEKLREILRKAEQFSDFVINRAYSESRGRNVSKYFLDNVLPIALLFKSEMEMSEFVGKIARKIGVHEESVWSDLKKLKLSKKTMSPTQTAIKIEESPDKSLASIIFFLQSKGKSDEAMRLRAKWEQFEGEDSVRSVIEGLETERDALIFRFEVFHPEEKALDIAEEVLARVELNYLKKRLTELSRSLDDKNVSESQRKKHESEIAKVSNRISDLIANYK